MNPPDTTTDELAGKRLRLVTAALPHGQPACGRDTLCVIVNPDGTTSKVFGVMSICVYVVGRLARLDARLTMRDGQVIQVEDVQLGERT